jgi:hypothetical protein
VEGGGVRQKGKAKIVMCPNSALSENSGQEYIFFFLNFGRSIFDHFPKQTAEFYLKEENVGS